MADVELVIKISKEDYEAIKDNSIIGDMTIPYVFEAIRNGTPLPDNATNGDVIKAMFPKALRSNYIENDMTIIYLQDEYESEMVVPENWWTAPYKAESEE